EVQEHRHWLAGLVAEAVDPARWHVHEVAGARLDPALAVMDPDVAAQDVERFGDGPMEVRAGSAGLRPHLPAVQPEQAVGRGASREVVHAGARRVDELGLVIGWSVRRAELAAVAQVARLR